MSRSRHMSIILRGFLSLAVLGVLAVTLHSLVFSGASFTSTATNAGNLVVAGSLSHTNDRDGGVLIDAAGLYPGASRSGTMTLTGTGDVPGAYTLAVTSLVNSPASANLAGALTLVIQQGATTLYQGPLSAVGQVALGTLAPGESRTCTMTLAYPAANADPSLSGASVALELTVTGVSQ